MERGNVNISTRLQANHLADLEAGNRIDRAVLALERTAAFYADELFDPAGLMLDEAADAWRRAERSDRADFVAALARELRSR